MKPVVGFLILASLSRPAWAHLQITVPVPSAVVPAQLKSELRYLSWPMTGEPMSDGGLKNREIAITIDDGPTPNGTPRVLEILKRYGVKATFFLIGRQAEAHPELVKLILQDGHSIGNHTWSHRAIGKDISLELGRAEIIHTQQVLNQIASGTGFSIQPFFRFPEGFGSSFSDHKLMLKNLGLANFYWSMSAHDSRMREPEAIYQTSVAMLDTYKKGIFLCHETHPYTIEMLPRFFDELIRRGYTTIYFQAAAPK